MEIVKNYACAHLRIIHDEKKGVYRSLNIGIGRATGDIVGILHSDDFLAYPKAIEDVVNAFIAGKVDGVYGDLSYVKRNNPKKSIRYWRAGDFKYTNLTKGWAPPHPALFLKKSIYDKSGLFDTSFSIAADYDFMLRVLADPALKVYYLPEVLVKMRLGGLSNKNLSCFLRKTYEDYLVLKKNLIPLPFFTLIAKIYRKRRQYIERPLL
jgi:glycosyltransferase